MPSQASVKENMVMNDRPSIGLQRRIGTGQKIMENNGGFIPTSSSGERRNTHVPAQLLKKNRNMKGPAGYTDVVDVVHQPGAVHLLNQRSSGIPKPMSKFSIVSQDSTINVSNNAP